MSVLTLSPEIFNYIRSGIERAAYNTVVDEFHYSPIFAHFRDKDIEKESKRLIASWCDLNYKSYAHKYKEEFESFVPFLKVTFTKTPFCPYQLLKFVECLYYNIEPEHWELTEQETADYNLLKNTEMAIAKAIVHSLPTYKTSHWSNY